MSKLLDDLRNEQRHYEQSVHGEGRAENIKRMADYIEDLEAKLAKAADLCMVYDTQPLSEFLKIKREFVEEIEKGE